MCEQRQVVRKRITIPVRGIPIRADMAEAALLIFGPEPPAIQRCIDDLLQIEYERIDRELLGGIK